jgi:hypothetical protein
MCWLIVDSNSRMSIKRVNDDIEKIEVNPATIKRFVESSGVEVLKVWRRGGDHEERGMLKNQRSRSCCPMELIRCVDLPNLKTKRPASHSGFRKTTHCSGSEPGGHGHLDM